MSDIDWFLVGCVVRQEHIVGDLTADEKRMVIRRLMPRMLTHDDWYHAQSTAAKLTADQVAELLKTTVRSVQRTQAELRSWRNMTCPSPDCMEHIWVAPGTNVIEAHPLPKSDEQCRMSGQQMFTGLASIRPDLYQWVAS